MTFPPDSVEKIVGALGLDSADAGRLRGVEALERIADALEAQWYADHPGVPPSAFVRVKGNTRKIGGRIEPEDSGG